jgi:hypothetical protein
MRETRTYKINAPKNHLKTIEEMLSYMEYLGSIGHSTTFNIFVDGDGAARIKVFDSEDNRLLDVNNNRENIKARMDNNHNIKSFCID